MKVGYLTISGPQVWPDQLLDVNRRSLIGFVISIGRWALGFECSGLRVAYVYLGWWCFEFDNEASES